MLDSTEILYEGFAMSSTVSRPAAADKQRAVEHFESLLEFETDCWDVHHATTNERKDFILLEFYGCFLTSK